MRDRFEGREVYEYLGLPVDECVAAQNESGYMKAFRTMLFQRIVPIVRDIGLWSSKIQAAYAEMGVLEFAKTDYEALMRNDNERAEEFDAANKAKRRRYVESVAAEGAAAIAAE